MIALKIILGIILFFVLLFSVKFTFYVEYRDELKLDVRWLFIKLHILPSKPLTEEEKAEKAAKKRAKEDKKKAKAAQKAAKKKENGAEPTDNTKKDAKPTKKQDNMFLAFYKTQGFSGVITLINDTVKAINGMFGGIFKHIVFHELKLWFNIGESDAAKTAISYGKVCSFVFPAMGLITNTCRVKDYGCTVEPDFNRNEKSASFKATVSVRPIFITNAVVALAFKLLFKVVLKLLMNKPEENQNPKNIKEEHKL